MAFNSASQRYFLPSIVKKQKSMAYETFWVEEVPTTVHLLSGEVWLLGERYILPQDKAALTEDVRSRLWFTYRRGFRPISGTNVITDSGWGCTLRCGQMMLSHALILRHLGRNWRWCPDTSNLIYNKILEMFLDSRDSPYSLQMIALQGADFGRSVGQWFGPNNVAQAIKRLAVHDEWSQLAVYVAMDMLVIIDDIKALCQEHHGITGSVSVEVTTEKGEKVDTPTKLTEEGPRHSVSDPSLGFFSKMKLRSTTSAAAVENTHSVLSPTRSKSFRGISFSHSSSRSSQVSRSYDPTADSSLIHLTMDDFIRQFSGESNLPKTKEEVDSIPSPISSPSSVFRPLLLFIPLRLGQERFNMEYADAVKACLTVPQSVGIIGGKPRHALWLIGYQDNYLHYLDPHRTQPSIPVPSNGEAIPDSTYHCPQSETMLISELDPSLALGFFCKDEEDVDDLCSRLRSQVLSKMQYLFELTEHRPPYWGPPESFNHSSKEPFVLLQREDKSVESDEGFELVDWPYPPPQQVATPTS